MNTHDLSENNIRAACAHEQTLLEAEREQRLMAETLREISLALTSKTHYEDILAEIVKQAHRLVPFTTANIALLEGDYLRIAQMSGYSESYIQHPVTTRRRWDALPLDRQAIESQSPIFIADTAQSDLWKTLGKTTWRSYICVPITHQDQVLGLLRINGKRPHQFTEQDIQRLEPLANAAATSLANARLLAQTRRQAEEIQALYRISQDLTALRDLDTLLHQIIERAMQLLDGEAGGIYLYRPERHQLEWTVSIGEYVAAIGTTLDYGEGLSGRVWQSGKVQMIKDYGSWEGKTDKWLPLPATIAAVPVQWGEQFLGVLNIRAGQQRDPFSSEELALLSQFAAQTAIAIHNAQLYEKAQREISERKRAEAELLALFNHVPIGLYRSTPEGKILDANPSLIHTLGYPNRRALLQQDAQDLYVNLEDRQQQHENLEYDDIVLGNEVQLRRYDGAIIWVRDTARAVRDAEGHIVYYEGAIEDITERKKAREERERLMKRQQRQERLAAIGQLAAGIAHDFNNIMAVIVLYAQITLRSTDLSEKVRERLHTIVEQTQRATDLIQQILDFSRRAVLERREMDLRPVLHDQVRLLERTLPSNIKIKLIHENHPYMVNADLTRIQQVVMNLAVNARDAMPEGGDLHITLDHTTITGKEHAPLDELEPGAWIRLSMTDTGNGIPPEVRHRIFEPFFTTKGPDKGTGLGLAQVYGIAKQHDGTVTVESTPGQGTTFSLYLPALQTYPTQTDVPMNSDLPDGQNEIILLVEDNVTTRQALASSLELLHYQPLQAANGTQALKLYAQHKDDIALILTDLIMPEMGGQSLLQTLKQQAAPPPVVILSGNIAIEGLQPLDTLGAAARLSKPVSLEELAQTLHKVLHT